MPKPNPVPRKALRLIGDALYELDLATGKLTPLTEHGDLEVIIRSLRAMDNIGRARVKLMEIQKDSKSAGTEEG